MEYLISYCFTNNNQLVFANAIIDIRPSGWLMDCRTEYPDGNYVLINWKKLNMDKMDDKLLFTAGSELGL